MDPGGLVEVFQGRTQRGGMGGRMSWISWIAALMLLMLGLVNGQTCPDVVLGSKQVLTPPADANVEKIFFGTEVEVRGDYVAVGAHGYLEKKGAVYVYKWNGSWSLMQTLQLSGAQELDKFGRKLAIGEAYGKVVIVVGAPGRQTYGKSSGAAYVYELNGGSFQLVQTLIAPGTNGLGHLNAEFGSAVATDDNLICIGSKKQDKVESSGTILVEKTGAIFCFRKTTENGSYQLKQIEFGETQGEKYGDSVAVKGISDYSGPKLVLVGSPRDGSNQTGAVYLYSLDQGQLSLVEKFKPTEGGVSSRGNYRSSFGKSISLTTDPEAFCIGGHKAGGTGEGDSGAVYCWENVNGTWRQNTAIYPSERAVSARYGRSVQRFRDIMIVGANGVAFGEIIRAGSAYINVKCSDGSWAQKASIQSKTPAKADALGKAVDISDRFVVVGAPKRDSGGMDDVGNRGAVHVYPYSVIPAEREIHYKGDPPTAIMNCPGESVQCPPTLYAAPETMRIGCLLLRGTSEITNLVFSPGSSQSPLPIGVGEVPSSSTSAASFTIPDNLSDGETVDLRLVMLHPDRLSEYKKTKAPLTVIPCISGGDILQ